MASYTGDTCYVGTKEFVDTRGTNSGSVVSSGAYSGEFAYTTFTYDNIKSRTYTFTPKTKNGSKFLYWDMLSAGRDYSASVTFTTKPGSIISTPVRLYATFGYTVRFFEKEGDVDPISTQDVPYGQNAVSPSVPVRRGYNWNGWSSGFSSVTSNLDVYGTWSIVTYQPTIAGGGGSAGSSPSYQISSSAQIKTIALPARTGYSISGWSFSGYDGTAPYISDTTLTIPANTIGNFTATPTWRAHTYTVKFNANGGTGTAPVDQSFTYGTAQSLNANTFSRTGYTFLGWSINSSATSATYTDRQSVSNLTSVDGGVVTLYAVWRINSYDFNLTVGNGIAWIYYKVNGASSYEPTSSSKTVSVNYNTEYSVYADARQGYAYTATSSSNPRTGTVGTASPEPFSPVGTAISYVRPLDNQNADSAGTQSVYYTFEVNSYFSDAAHSSPSIIITKPTRTGFQFGGYYTGANGTGVAVIDSTGKILPAFCSVEIYDNTTPVYAKWIPNTYTIKIANGYDATVYPNVSATYGTPSEIVAITMRTGEEQKRANYRFAGWKVTTGLNPSYGVWGTEDDDCDTPIESDSEVLFNGTTGSIYVDKLTIVNGATVTLTAQWKRISYTVAVDNTEFADRFDLSSSASGSEYANGVLTFTALAGDSYSVTATFKSKSLQTLSWVIPVSVNGYTFSRTNEGSDTFAAFSASHAFGDDEDAEQGWEIGTRSVSVTTSNPRTESNLPVPMISFADEDTDGTSVKIVSSDYEGADFSAWDSLSPSGTTHTDLNLPAVTLSGIASDTSIRAVYQFARMSCVVAMDEKSYAATEDYSSEEWVWVKGSSHESWSHEIADVAYGSSVTYKFEKQSASTAPDYVFAGWYDVDGNLVSSNEEYAVSSVESAILLYAKLRVNVTLVKSIPAGADVSAQLILGDETYSGSSCYASFVIGSSVRIGVVLGEGAFFVNWFDSSDLSFESPLELAMNDELVVRDKTSITARVVDSESVYYVALYARDMTQPIPAISTTVGQLGISGESVTPMSKDEYAEVTGTVPLGDGVFAEVRGTQIVGLNAVKIADADFLWFRRRKLAGADEPSIISRSPSVRTIVNQSFVYLADFGSLEPSRVRASLASADDREKGFVEVGSSAIDISGDGVYAEGTFEVGETARVIAHPLNGWRFIGWFDDSSFSDDPVSEDAYYDFEAPHGGMTLYAKFEVDDGASLHKWEGSSERMLAKWRSKRYVLNKPSNLTSVRVDSDGYPVKRLIVQSFSSPTGDARSTIDFVTDVSRIANQDMRRLPTRRPERYFQVEIHNDAEVDAVFLGTSGEELAV